MVAVDRQPPVRTLTAKLVRPVVPPSFLERPTLTAHVDEALSRRLTTVVAGPGFGKSTLLSAWATARGCAWYSVTADDVSVGALARGLAHALRSQLPGLLGTLHSAIEHLQDPPTAAAALEQAHAVGGLLCDLLAEQLAEPFVLVLDDLQELGQAEPAGRLVEQLCREGAPQLHLVVASRVELPFAVERLRGQGQVLEIGARELTFTLEETRALLAGISDNEGVVAAVQDATGGWPAAVRLAVEALRGVPSSAHAAAFARLSHPGGALLDYLAAEVYAQEPLEVRRLLRTIASLELVSGALCEEIGFRRAPQRLAALARRGLLVERRAEASGWFSISEPLRELIHAQHPLPPDERRVLAARVASWHVSRGRIEDGLRAAAASEDQVAVAQLLRDHGRALLRAGAVDAVLRAVTAIPRELRGSELDELEGAARQIRGDADGALACFRRVASATGELTPGLAWRIGIIHHLRGRLEEALATYRRGRLEGTEPREEALLLAWAASAHWLRGEVEPCREKAARAFAIASEADDPQALAAAHTALALVAAHEGDRAANDAHYLRALDYAERAGDLLQLIRIHTNRASHHLEEGFYADALDELEPAMRLAELAGFASWQALALTNRGEARFHLGEVERAIADLRTAAAVYERIGSRMLCYPLAKLGDIHRERGDLALARHEYEEALALAEAGDDVQGMVPALAGLARVLVVSDPIEAMNTAERALAHASGLPLATALIAAAAVALENGEFEQSDSYAREAASVAGARRDRAGLAEALELEALAGAPRKRELLEEACAIWRDVGDPLGQSRAQLRLALAVGGAKGCSLARSARRRLQALGLRRQAAEADAALSALENQQRQPVAIETLGGFRVLRAGVPIPPAEWQSRKARDVLKILAARRGRRIPRDELMEALWPEGDPDRLANRLSVALATLRAVLDPERQFPADRYVAGDKSAIRLDLRHVGVDLELFLDGAEAGLALRREGRREEAVAALAAAETTYAGDFLEEDVYDDWAGPAREEAQALYMAVARALAEEAADDGDADGAARYLLRILERDAYDEPAHLGLVSVLLRARRHGEARRFYRIYCARMAEIGVEATPFPAPAPAPTTPPLADAAPR